MQAFYFLGTAAVIALVAGSAVSRRRIQNQVTKEKSLFAVVNGVWGHARWGSPQRILYLDTILRNYVALCEEGYKVGVALVTYDNADNRKWESIVQDENYYCMRIGAPISIDFFFFENRGLPPTAFGTPGDLAIRYRELFLKELNNYELFLVQEDDIDIRPASILYID